MHKRFDTLDQWCLQKLLEIKWYHHVQNSNNMRRTTGQPHLSTTVKARHFRHIVRLPDETDAKILTASPWRTTGDHQGTLVLSGLETIQQDLKSNNLSE